MERLGRNASFYKYFAAAVMLVDHIGAVILIRILYAQSADFARVYPIYRMTRNIGRLAFPIFCFFLVEGFYKTRNRAKHLVRLLLFALLAEFPFDLALTSGFSLYYQSTMVTLTIGFAAMWVMEECKRLPNLTLSWAARAVTAVAAYELAELARCDYGGKGLISILVLYLLYYNRWGRLIAGALTFYWEWPAMLSFPLLALYNGERGKSPKYFFYAFYPAHLVVLFAVCVLLGIAGIPAVR